MSNSLGVTMKMTVMGEDFIQWFIGRTNFAGKNLPDLVALIRSNVGCRLEKPRFYIECGAHFFTYQAASKKLNDFENDAR